MAARFQPGDHLQVRRPMGYYHHGIYVTEERVIQFGSGVTLLNKGETAINAVSLRDFEEGAAAEVVRHGYESWFTGHHPAADQPWMVIARAEFLLKLQPTLPYHLIGHNCEIIANMCASGSWTESYQVRRAFGARAYMDATLMIWLAARSRKNLPAPSWISPAAIAAAVLSVAAIRAYNYQIKKFWNEIRDDWLTHEHMLTEDPRNNTGR